MFKILKSKKGFTLVELMIVVVIMAILVAVAVPIYNAVTENSRKKTCLGNQRAIVGQINSTVMADHNVLAFDTGSKNIIIRTNDTGDGLLANDSGEVLGTDLGIEDQGVFVEKEGDAAGAHFLSLFNEKNQPYCPKAGKFLTVTVKSTGNNGYIEIDVACSDSNHKAN